MDLLVQDNLSTYGLIAVFVLLMLSSIGLALGEEMVTIPAGVFIATGEMQFVPTAIVAYVAIVTADIIWFLLCRRFGTPLLHRRWIKRFIHPRRLLELKHSFEERGAWIIVMARFIPSSRSTTIAVAGIMHMPFWRFVLATASCVVLTVPLQLGLGYLIGQGISTESTADLVLRVLGLVMLIVLVTVVVGWWFGRRKGRLPRAKASWLRRFRPKRIRPRFSAIRSGGAPKTGTEKGP